MAVDTLADVEDLYRGIDLGSVTTSMTINGPAAVIFAMYVANAEATGVERARLGGTLQNDILKEYQAQKEFIFPPHGRRCGWCATRRVLYGRVAAVASDLDFRHYHIPKGGIDCGPEWRSPWRTASPARTRTAQVASTSMPSRRACRSSSMPT